MQKILFLMTLSLLTLFIGSSFKPRPQIKKQEQEKKYFNTLGDEIQKIRKECYWQIEIIEPQPHSDGEYRDITIGFGPKSTTPQYHIFKVDFTNEKQCPRFHPDSRLTITLPDGRTIETMAPHELNKEPSRKLLARSFCEQCYYQLPTTQLLEILSAPSFIIEAEGEAFNVKAAFTRKTL